MTAPEIIQEIEAAGGVLTLNGDRIRYDVPKGARALVDVLREHRGEVLLVLRQRLHRHPDPCDQAVAKVNNEGLPKMPAGIRLLERAPKQAPVILTRYSVVTDVPNFLSTTFEQLRAALDGRTWHAGNWSVRELVDRLEQCGVRVEVTR